MGLRVLKVLWQVTVPRPTCWKWCDNLNYLMLWPVSRVYLWMVCKHHHQIWGWQSSDCQAWDRGHNVSCIAWNPSLLCSSKNLASRAFFNGFLVILILVFSAWTLGWYQACCLIEAWTAWRGKEYGRPRFWPHCKSTRDYNIRCEPMMRVTDV